MAKKFTDKEIYHLLRADVITRRLSGMTVTPHLPMAKP
jgi:hypothetical protein